MTQIGIGYLHSFAWKILQTQLEMLTFKYLTEILHKKGDLMLNSPCVW